MNSKLLYTLILILFAAIGTGWILSVWLYDSYQRRVDFLTNQVEFTLFDAVQEQYRNILLKSGEEDSVTRKAAHPFSRQLVSRFPTLNQREVAAWLDSIPPGPYSNPDMSRGYLKHRKPLPFDRPRQGFVPRNHEVRVLPPIGFLENVNDSISLEAIKDLFSQRLNENNVDISYAVEKFRLTPEEFESQILKKSDRRSSERQILNFETKPILINPNDGTFIKVVIQYPWYTFFLQNMSWQLILAFLILGAVIGTFVYLFQTLLKQNKLDILRRDFVNSLTHELRTPVATVSAALQALSEKEITQKYDLFDTYREIAVSELDHLSYMIDKVLLLADKGPINRNTLNVQEYSPAKMLEDIVDTHRQLQSNKVKVIWKANTYEDIVTGDPNLLKSVINTILENAIKYGAQHITIGLKRTDDSRAKTFAIEIQDDGIGIHPAYHQQIFKPFFRVPQGNLYSTKGFGLGLSYALMIVKQHNGRLNVRSSIGNGATFTLVLPKKVTQ